MPGLMVKSNPILASVRGSIVLAWLQVMSREALCLVAGRLRPRLHLLLLIAFLSIPSLALLRSVVVVPFQQFLEGMSEAPSVLSLFILFAILGRLSGRILRLAEKGVADSPFFASLPVLPVSRVSGIAAFCFGASVAIAGMYVVFASVNRGGVDILSATSVAGLAILLFVTFLSSLCAFLSPVYSGLAFPIAASIVAVISAKIDYNVALSVAIILSAASVTLLYKDDSRSNNRHRDGLERSARRWKGADAFPEWDIKLRLIAKINENSIVTNVSLYLLAFSFAAVLMVEEPAKALFLCVACATLIAVALGLRFRDLACSEEAHPFLASFPQERVVAVVGALTHAAPKELVGFLLLCVLAATFANTSAALLLACVFVFAVKILASYCVSRVSRNNFVFWLSVIFSVIIAVEAALYF